MKLSDLSQNTSVIDNPIQQPKMKLSDIVKESAMAADKNNPSMQGGAKSPANLLAQKKLQSRQLKDDMLDVPIAPLAAANQFAGDIPRMLSGGKFPKPITSGGKAISDVGGAMGAVASPVYRAEGFGAGKLLGGVGKAISKVLPESWTGFAKTVEDRIYGLYNSAVGGAKTKNIGELTKTKGSRVAAMKAIHDNLSDIKLPNPETGELESRVPKNRLDLAHAFQQTKQNIWKKVTALSQGATNQGATVELGKLAEKAGADAKKSIGSIALKSNPQLAEAIDTAVTNIRMAGEKISPTEAQDYMKYLFSETQRLKKSGQGVDYSVKDLYNHLLGHLNEATDDAIEQALDKGGYGDLRKQYASLKVSEKEVLNSANRFMSREAKGGNSHPFVNLWSLEDAMQGVGQMATGHPAVGASRIASGAAIKMASKLSDHMMSPDRRIGEMFKLIGKYAPGKSAISNLEGTRIPEIGELSKQEGITKRPNQYVKTSQKEWPTKEKYRDGIPIEDVK